MTTEKRPVSVSLFLLTFAVVLGLAVLSACGSSPKAEPCHDAESVLGDAPTRGKVGGDTLQPGEPEPSQTVLHVAEVTAGSDLQEDAAAKGKLPMRETPEPGTPSFSEEDEVNLRLAEALRELGSFYAPVDKGSATTAENRGRRNVQVVSGKVFVQIYFEGAEKDVVAKLKEIGADILMRMATPKMVVARVDAGRLDDATRVEGVWFVDYGFDKYDAIKKGEMRGVDVEKAK